MRSPIRWFALVFMAAFFSSFLFIGSSFAQSDESTSSVETLDSDDEDLLSDFDEEEELTNEAEEDEDLLAEDKGQESTDSSSEESSEGSEDEPLIADVGEEDDDLFATGLEKEAPLPKKKAPVVVNAPVESPVSLSKEGRITDLKFLAEENGGTVVIESNRALTYTARRNPRDRQLVIEVSGRLPKRLERPFVTKDFPSAIGSINAYQPVGSDRSFVVVQMKNATFPTVQQTGNRIILAVLPSGEQPTDGATAMKKNLAEFLLSEQKFRGKKINIEVGETSIRNVLNLISDQSGVNMIISDDVEGTTSTKLRDIPWDQALILVLQANQLGYQRQGNVLRIATLERLGAEAAAIKKLSVEKAGSVPLVLKVIQVNYAKAEGLSKQLAGFLSKRGKLSIDTRTNSILIHGLPSEVKKIEKLINTLDYAPPQVLIEGKVVEAQSNLAKDIGVNWGFSGSGVKIGTNNSGGEVNITPSLDISPTAAGVGTGGLNLNLNVGTLDLLGDLSARLALFERTERVKVVSSPKVVTLTNEEAVITQTTDIPIITSTVSNGSVTKGVTFQPVKLELKVTPLVTSDNSIILDVDLSREFAGGVVEQDTQARPINKRVAKTKVLVKNGQTAVLGGIFQSDATESEQGVPYLRKIPIFGRLFEAKSKTQEKNELMVFITPRVVVEQPTRRY